MTELSPSSIPPPVAPALHARAAASAQDLASQIAIVLSNALVIGIAWHAGWPLGTLLWPYWIQSVLIGVFNFLRIWRLHQFSSAGVSVNGIPMSASPTAARMVAGFFAMHYGFFHLVYLFFLFAIAPWPRGQTLGILLAAAIFAIGQYRAWRQHLREDAAGASNIGTLMALPYLRIVPMHLIIILGALLRGSGWALLLFGTLKTAAELYGVYLEQRLAARMSRTANDAAIASTGGER